MAWHNQVCFTKVEVRFQKRNLSAFSVHRTNWPENVITDQKEPEIGTMALALKELDDLPRNIRILGALVIVIALYLGFPR